MKESVVINLTELCKQNHHHLSKILNRTKANKLKAQGDQTPKQGA